MVAHPVEKYRIFSNFAVMDHLFDLFTESNHKTNTAMNAQNNVITEMVITLHKMNENTFFASIFAKVFFKNSNIFATLFNSVRNKMRED